MNYGDKANSLSQTLIYSHDTTNSMSRWSLHKRSIWPSFTLAR